MMWWGMWIPDMDYQELDYVGIENTGIFSLQEYNL